VTARDGKCVVFQLFKLCAVPGAPGATPRLRQGGPAPGAAVETPRIRTVKVSQRFFAFLGGVLHGYSYLKRVFLMISPDFRGSSVLKSKLAKRQQVH